MSRFDAARLAPYHPKMAKLLAIPARIYQLFATMR